MKGILYKKFCDKTLWNKLLWENNSLWADDRIISELGQIQDQKAIKA